MKKKKQIFIIHGGMTFRNKKDYLEYLRTRKIRLEDKNSWTGKYLKEKLGRQFDIIRPRMPLQDNARYEDWKIYFERFIPKMRSGAILIGSSLGGVFLAKYLSENKFPKKILSTYLICPPYDNTLPGEDLVGGFKLKSNLSLLQKNTKNLYLMFSRDDEVIPIAHAEKYKKKLPNAIINIYNSKGGHFQVSTFPEIIKLIMRDKKNGN